MGLQRFREEHRKRGEELKAAFEKDPTPETALAWKKYQDAESYLNVSCVIAGYRRLAREESGETGLTVFF